MSELMDIFQPNDEIAEGIIKDFFDKRKIIINQDISDMLLENVVMAIMKWNFEDKNMPIVARKKIYIFINSDGGDVVFGTQILNAIKCSKTPIVTVGMGKCSSMASYILVAGHERYCFPNTVVLLHDGTTGYMSSGNKGKDIQKFLDSLDEIVNNFMVDNSKMTMEFLEEIKDREYYMFGIEAKERGLVDGIVGTDIDMDDLL